MVDFNDRREFWHGSPSGDLRGGAWGVHVGTKEAARQALHARIGEPAEGTWDGTREYGKTLLNRDVGRSTLIGEPGDLGTHWEFSTEHREPSLPSGEAVYSDGSPVEMTAKPNIFPVHITGPMTNTPKTPHQDWKANGYMHGQIKRGRAKRGYYYINEGEDDGSLSAVVPNGGGHLQRNQFGDQ